ncbi:MAG: cobalamin biosynthesis protein [Parasporobacterium sp.]|nr:cobalamin biosynthesis protein [Parasporobacterium sp.]
MKYTVFAYTRKGLQTALRMMDYLKTSDEEAQITAYTVQRLMEETSDSKSCSDDLCADSYSIADMYDAAGEPSEFMPLPGDRAGVYSKMFSISDAMIFVGSAGIAVRNIAPYVFSKASDPAVICADELGRYVIPLLSGHIGGANNLALKLAYAIGGTAVITTATDINDRFSADAWAVRNDLVIEDIRMVKVISAAVLERKVPLISDIEIEGEVPEGIMVIDEGCIGENPLYRETGIYIGHRTDRPFEKTLHLIPKDVCLGIGCRKDISAEAVRKAVETVLEDNGICKAAVKHAASIDIKAGEQGLLSYMNDENIPITFYSARELMTVRGEFKASEFVKEITGVENVCERAALMKADRMLVHKTVVNGVTVAAAFKTIKLKW